MIKSKIAKLIDIMTIEEKAGLCSGSDFWHTQAIPDKQIPSVMFCDGPHGLRKQNLEEEDCELASAIDAVCFPTAAALASSFDTELVEKVGAALGNECRAENVAVLLGPGNNIKRSPLCGRNFEYFSEDPYLAGKMASAHIRGVQSTGVGTSLKHFCANNQEFSRNTSNSVIDERTFREIYLTPFEIAVKEAQPKTVMCSYNLINGVQASENKRTLTDILRTEWGFSGLVMSDWGAVKDRAKSIAAGLDLEMPGCGKANDVRILEAVKSGELSEEELDNCVERILNLVFDSIENSQNDAIWDKKADHILSKSVATECMVLLKNDDSVLPLSPSDYIAVIGGFAKTPRFQGGGSSHITTSRVESALLALAGNSHVVFEQGFSASDDSYDEKLFNRAVEAARDVDKCIIFAGLPDSYEVEGWDRTHMELPKVQNDLIEAVCKECNHVIVVLHNGSPVTMPWADKVQGILEAYLAGEGCGGAVMDVLYGRVNPSGRLAETFPKKLSDTPCYLDFGEGSLESVYREGIYVGYRYYTAKDIPVQFPFGYGLSYTRFSYGNMKLDMDRMRDDDVTEVSVDVINEGDIVGKDVVQLYIAPPKGEVRRPVRELKGFEKVTVKPKERKRVSFALDKRSFAYYDTELGDWYVTPGEYKIQICRDADTVACEIPIYVEPVCPKNAVFTVNSLFGDVYASEDTTKVFEEFIEEFSNHPIRNNNAVAGAFEVLKDPATGRFISDMPLRSLVNLSDGRVLYNELVEFIDKLNNTGEER